MCEAGENVLFDGHSGAICRNESDFREAICLLRDQGHTHWVAKPAWSAAGRSRLSGQTDHIGDSQRSWLNRQWQQFGYVWLEPWLTVLRECGIQLEIAPPGQTTTEDSVRVTGVAEMLTDHSGRYCGSLVTSQVESLWSPAIRHAVAAAREAARRGYFGPMGIDCMQVVLPDGRKSVRVCHDINGRLTMGRLALQLQPRIPAGSTGLWMHSAVGDCLPNPAGCSDSPAIDGIGDVEAVSISPQQIGGRPTQVESRLYIVRSPEKSQNLLEFFQQHTGIRKHHCD